MCNPNTPCSNGRIRPLSVIRSLEMRAVKLPFAQVPSMAMAAGAVLFALPLPFGIETKRGPAAPGQRRFPIANRWQPSKEG